MTSTDYWPVASGWQWRAYIGGRQSPDRILGGWAPDKATAEKRAQEAAGI